jgi:hypothetical protein
VLEIKYICLNSFNIPNNNSIIEKIVGASSIRQLNQIPAAEVNMYTRLQEILKAGAKRYKRCEDYFLKKQGRRQMQHQKSMRSRFRNNIENLKKDFSAMEKLNKRSTTKVSHQGNKKARDQRRECTAAW